MKRLLLALVVSTSPLTNFAACHTGPSATEFPPAVTGHGIKGTLQLSGRRIEGELLAMRASDFVMLTDSGVVAVPFSLATSGQFPGSDVRYRGGTPDAPTIERLRLLSRFPHGMSEVATAVVLRSTGQSAVPVLQP